MRALIQRVTQASVTVEKQVVSSIGHGLLILLGIEESDNQEDIDYLVKKITQLRIFDDEQGIMNRSVLDVDGQLLIVSQFTLHASTKKGNRPSYIRAAPPEIAEPIYLKFINVIEDTTGIRPGTGKFGAMMNVSLINDGPVTIMIDSKDKAF